MAPRAARPVVVLAVVAALVSCGRLTAAESSPPPWPLVAQLLADEPALPPTLIWTIPPAGTAVGPEDLEWEGSEPDVRIDVPWECPEPGRAMAREWFRDGVTLRLPHVRQAMCAYGDEASALAAYDDATLEEIYRDDLTNFDDPAEVEAQGWAIRPSAPPPALSAAASDIACNGGDANGVCSLWLYRARYSHVITVVSVFSQGGGLRYEDFEALVVSVDRHITETLKDV